MSDGELPPKVAAPHLCGGPTCYFCDWSNPTLDIPEVKSNGQGHTPLLHPHE